MENQNENNILAFNAGGVAVENEINTLPNIPSNAERKITFNEPQVFVPPAPPPTLPIEQNMPPQAAPQIKYAGFWVRYIANVIDGLILSIPIGIIVLLLLFLFAWPLIPAGGKQPNVSPWINIMIRLVAALLGWCYFIIMTKKYQATFGKKAVGIKVVSDKSEELTWGQLILRETIGKLLSAIILYIGYIMAGFTERKQALHDKIAKTVVVHKDPNQKIAWWAIALALVLPTIAIIGILASIVLVSLSSARNKAQDASVKSSMMSLAPDMILYQDAHSSYLGYEPNAGFNLIACSGQPIINISPDGKNMAVFAQLCSDKTKYFCVDPQNAQEVSEQYAKNGAISCSSNESVNTPNMPTNQSSGMENQVTPVNQDTTSQVSTNDISVFNQMNTRDAYNQSINLLSGQKNIKLIHIQVDNSNTDPKKPVFGKFLFLFATDTEETVVEYNPVNKSVQITSQGDYVNHPQLKDDVARPVISDTFLEAGFEGALNILFNNEDYQRYREKNPSAFNKYSVITIDEQQYGWEWHFNFSDGTISDSGKKIEFAVNPGRSKVVVASKTNIND